MLIVQATRVLTEVHWSMFAKINTDSLGNPCETVTVGLSALDSDAHSALTQDQVAYALRRLAARAEKTLREERNLWWGDLI